MRAVAVPGGPARRSSHRSTHRWAWGVSGLVVAAALAVPGTRLITLAGVPWSSSPPSAVTVRNVTVPQPVTGLTVRSYGGQIRVTAGQVSRVQVTERIVYDPKAGGPPAVAESVAGGQLTLGDPACGSADCAVDFTVIVPSAVDVTVDTQGGPASVSAISGATGTSVNTDGGAAMIRQVTGPLTVSTGGGPLIMNDVAGPLRADTAGGSLTAQGITAATATLDTGGGPAQVAFSAAPKAVTMNTDGGPAILRVPGGPYALTADSAGGPELIGIATDPSARASLTISSGGGPLQLEPPSAPS
jgi:hypothetical protein